MTQLRDEMATWSPDEELVFLAEILAGYRGRRGRRNSGSPSTMTRTPCA